MENIFKISKITDTSLVGFGFLVDYSEGYKNGKNIYTRFNLDNAIQLFDGAFSNLSIPGNFFNRINELEKELNEFYTENECRMIINIFKRIISETSSLHFDSVNIGYGIDQILITNSVYWEYIIDDSIYDLSCIEYVDYFKYHDSLTYVAEFNFAEYDENMNEIDSYKHTEILTDQIHDYWGLDIIKEIQTQKFKTGCFTEVILTFEDGQEISHLYLPFDKLTNSTIFSEYIMNNVVISIKRSKSLRKISTLIIPTLDQIVKMGEAYNEFTEWYLLCNGKFYFNETDK